MQRKIKKATFDLFTRAEIGIFNAPLRDILNALYAGFRTEKSIYYIEKEITLNAVHEDR